MYLYTCSHSRTFSYLQDDFYFFVTVSVWSKVLSTCDNFICKCDQDLYLYVNPIYYALHYIFYLLNSIFDFFSLQLFSYFITSNTFLKLFSAWLLSFRCSTSTSYCESEVQVHFQNRSALTRRLAQVRACMGHHIAETQWRDTLTSLPVPAF